ncbi:type II toxin-antitoxin system RelE/ParE family toxin [Microcoleus sp. bin38.metabat.b11b12b14.051]|uniref:type II toxin-antitoxin system RelE/ParE family toxin n=1 Tax=Microcoleus sp. bin38.metabat.b11b12b14.051 TaxID=2742709 RepID=UPI0025D6D1C4|nr:type II toxin-antitoxin system RelE/ParE family toxin [Microcoleus sp. bin38.metabat.b11b12b14.051]
MTEIHKRSIVIKDLIEHATDMAQDNLEVAEQFLVAADETFKLLGKMPGLGKMSQFYNPRLANIRQYQIRGFKRYLIFYRAEETGVEILRVLHGVRDLEAILDEYLENEEL